MPEILLDEAARRDLIEIWQYIARDNERAADAMLDRMQQGMDVIARFPQGGTGTARFDPGVAVLFCWQLCNLLSAARGRR